MIKVNLLPPGTRPSAAASLVAALPWRQIGIGAGGILILVSVWLFVSHMVQSRSLAGLTIQWQEIQPQRARLEEVRATLSAIQNRAAVLDALKAPQARWAPRLNLLSDSLVVDLWFTRLKFGSLTPSQEGAPSPDGPAASPSATMLGLTGFALVVPQADQSAAPVSRFLKKLMAHPEFQQLFQNVELVALKHRQIGKGEVSDFSILFQPTGG